MTNMAKCSGRPLLGFLFLPLLYAVLFRLNLFPFDLWKSQWRSSLSFEPSHPEFHQAAEFLKPQLMRLLRGVGQQELEQNGLGCSISNDHSDICVSDHPVRITAGSGGIIVHIADGRTLARPLNLTLYPYPRKSDPIAISRTTAVTLLRSAVAPPPCSCHYTSPALLFSAGGYAGNFFHDINDVLIPLFLTSTPIRPHLRLLITDLRSYWSQKYRRILRLFSAFDPLPLPSASNRVLCFPSAIIGLRYHGNLLCNSTEPPGGISTVDFRRFLQESLSLPSSTDRLILVLISRRKSRVIVNEKDAVRAAKEAGFDVVVAQPEMASRVDGFAGLVHGCSVLMGVHGAGLANLVFLRPRAVLLQIVPWGLEWAAAEYYERPARRLGLGYAEYRVKVEESSLYEQYPRDHPVIADPWSVNRKGYNVSRPVYTDGQDLRIDAVRLRDTLLQTRRLLTMPPPPSPSSAAAAAAA